jgi:isopentenyl diphosphate isomerase/L-lactate dehydrogenase-like FMN-dependent dehydrogenase
VNEFLRILARQVAADVRALPATAQSRLTDEGRVARCRNIAELRALARRRMPRTVFDYVDGAAWDEVTSRRNQQDFGKLAIRPRVLVDVSRVDTATWVLGRPVSVPIIGAPTGQSGLTHHRGEAAVARALHASGTITTLSTAASYSIEEVAAESPGPTWFQLYVPRDRGLARDLLERARAAGHLALVLTVDVPRAGARERDQRNGFSVPPRITLRSLADGVVRPRWSAAFVRSPRILMANFADRLEGANAVTMAEFINDQFDPAVTWSDLEWMREVWAGPVVVKGILRPDDARTAADLGAAGILVSNHGGRQLDHAPSAVQALPAIVEAVGGDAEVYLDGGVRRGTDILKAIALGARACMVGRPLIYGLGAGGEAGVGRAVAILSNELRLAMALAGCPALDAIDGSLVGPA